MRFHDPNVFFSALTSVCCGLLADELDVTRQVVARPRHKTEPIVHRLVEDDRDPS